MESTEFTKRGNPALWEKGGGMTNTGSARIVAGPQGEALRPIYVPRGYANGDHAMFPVGVGMLLIYASKSSQGVWVNRLGPIRTHEAEPDSADYNRRVRRWDAELVRLASYERGEWDTEPEPAWEPAIEAARHKAACYHCRHVHYASA